MKLEWRPGRKKDPLEGLTPEQKADAYAAKEKAEAMVRGFQEHTGAIAAENEKLMDDLLKKNQEEIDKLKRQTGGTYEKF